MRNFTQKIKEAYYMIVIIELENKTHNEVRREVTQHGLKLPFYFDFNQHISVTIDTDKKKIIEVVKKY